MARLLDGSALAKFLLLITIILASLASTVGAAQPEDTSDAQWATEASDALDKLENTLLPVDPQRADIDAIGAALKRVISIRGRAESCATRAQEELDGVKETLASLGEAQGGEPADVAKGRRELQAQQTALEQRLASCNLVAVRAAALADELGRGHQSILAQRIFAKGPNMLTVATASLASPSQVLESFWRFLEAEGQNHLPAAGDWLGLMLALAVGAAMGFGLRKWLFAEIPRSRAGGGSAAAFGLALRVEVRRDLPVVLGLTAASAYLLAALPISPLPFLTTLFVGLTLFALTLSTLNVLMIPHAPAADWLSEPADATRALGRRLKVLATLGLLGVLLFETSLGDALSSDLHFLVRGVFGTVVILNLVLIVWLTRRYNWSLFGRTPRLLVMVALVGVLVAEYAGYRNLAAYLLMGLTGTLFGLGIALLVTVLLNDLFDGLEEGRLAWQRALRARLSVHEGELVPGLPWIRIFTTLLIWGSFGVWALQAWGLTAQGRSIAMPYLTSGFTVGSLQIVPVYLLGAILALALLLNLSRFIKQRVMPRWLRHTRLDQGAREAVAAITGYTGIAISVLIALSIAGFEMQNLAIIAGALSVGIGFGLQNVVNNFVSGLILLFERPIRRGDWIVAGSTEGFVKSINIRSTQIQTFDRADVIVPNSELIAQQVTNWMLADRFGRVVIPVGVSYASDPDHVRDILLGVAQDHPLVVTGDQEIPGPSVVFRRFGDSSLDFELRCFIRRVEERLNTLSDINFEIFRAFRRAGIEIPFPQRDLHLRSWPGRDDGAPAPDALEPPG